MFDSGFNGYLALPPATIAELGLMRAFETGIVLADGAERSVPAYAGLATLEGELLEFPVTELEGEPLAGMSLLAGHNVSLDIAAGGSVRIARRP